MPVAKPSALNNRAWGKRVYTSARLRSKEKTTDMLSHKISRLLLCARKSLEHLRMHQLMALASFMCMASSIQNCLEQTVFQQLPSSIGRGISGKSSIMSNHRGTRQEYSDTKLCRDLEKTLLKSWRALCNACSRADLPLLCIQNQLRSENLPCVEIHGRGKLAVTAP